MIAVIFEVEPKPGCAPEYFGIAAELRPMLEHIEGFISIERFESVTQPGRFLSLSFWRDERAIREWRSQESHRAAQLRGRARLFRDYRLRVADVIRDYGLDDRTHAPATAESRS